MDPTFIFRFHLSKCLYAKIRGQFRLGHYLRASGSPAVMVLSHLLRQYFALSLLKPEHMKPEMDRIEDELKTQTLAFCTADDRKRFMLFHHYVIKTWMIGHGPEQISVFGAKFKTNNVIERLD